jgi:hypothetical protein
MNRHLLALTCASALLFPAAASAQVTDYNIFEENFLTQTGPGTATSNANGWTFTANLTTATSLDTDSATVTAPDSTVYVMDTASPGSSPAVYTTQQNFSSQAALETAFPTNSSYTFWLYSDAGTDTGAITFPSVGTGAGQISYPSATPLISNYAAMQNLNAAQDFTFTFSGFNVVNGLTEQDLFLDVFNADTSAEVFSADFLAPTTTGVTLAANTLQAGTDYYVVLDYSNRLDTGDFGFGDLNGNDGDGFPTPYVGLDLNTIAYFTTDSVAVPEPGTIPMFLAGAGLLVFGRRFLRRG